MSSINYWLSGVFMRLWGEESAIRELRTRKVTVEYNICSQLRAAYNEKDEAMRHHYIEVSYLMAKKMHRKLRYYKLKYEE